MSLFKKLFGGKEPNEVDSTEIPPSNIDKSDDTVRKSTSLEERIQNMISNLEGYNALVTDDGRGDKHVQTHTYPENEVPKFTLRNALEEAEGICISHDIQEIDAANLASSHAPRLLEQAQKYYTEQKKHYKENKSQQSASDYGWKHDDQPSIHGSTLDQLSEKKEETFSQAANIAQAAIVLQAALQKDNPAFKLPLKMGTPDDNRDIYDQKDPFTRGKEEEISYRNRISEIQKNNERWDGSRGA